MKWALAIALHALPPAAFGGERLIDIARGDQDATIYGYGRNQLTGRALTIGDFNGDNVGDLAFSLMGDGPGGTRLAAGEVQILFGGARFPGSRVLDADPGDVVIYGRSASDRFGLFLGSGDLDGDGIADLIIATPYAEANGRPSSGVVDVFYGRRSWPSSIDLALSPPDIEVRGDTDDSLESGIVGDLNGDGVPDLILGASQSSGPGRSRIQAGEAIVFFGPVAGGVTDLASRTGDLMVYGANRGDQLTAASGLADLDGDGRTDLALVAQGFANMGAVFAFRGPLSGGVIDLVTATPEIRVLGASGWRLTYRHAIGDVNADGTSDLVPSAVNRVLGFFGGPRLLGDWDLALRDPDVGLQGSQGVSLGGPVIIGDVTGDAEGDVITSDSNALRTDPPVGVAAGAVYAIAGGCYFPSGIDLGYQSAALRVEGAEFGDSVGSALATGDLDGDGLGDLAVSATSADGFANGVPGDAGEIYVVYGKPRQLATFDVHRGTDPAITPLHAANAAAPIDETPGLLRDGVDYYYNLEGPLAATAVLAVNRQRRDDTVRLSWFDPDRCTAIPVSAARSTIGSTAACVRADGLDIATITVIPRDDFGDILGTGLSVSIDALAITPGVLVGDVRDGFVGTYSQEVVAASPGTGRLVATVESAKIGPAGSIQFVSSRPTAGFTWTAPVRAGLPVAFTDQSAGGIAPYALAWDFESDGTPDSVDPAPSHTYSQPGTYEATLAVTDAQGCPATARRQIDVMP